MIADPLTLTATKLVSSTIINGQADMFNEDDIVLNKLGIGPGAKSTGSVPASTLVSVGATALTMSVSHQPTSAGRIRSSLRFDTGAKDSENVVHTAAAYIVLDREQLATTAGSSAVITALCALIRFLADPVSTTTIKPALTLAEFVNGEA